MKKKKNLYTLKFYEKKKILYTFLLLILSVACLYLYIFSNFHKSVNDQAKIYKWFSKKIDFEVKNTIKKLLFPWHVIKILEAENKSLRFQSSKLSNSLRLQSSKLSNLEINFKNSYEEYLEKSFNYASNNSQKIIKEIKRDFILGEELITKKKIKNRTIVSYETIKHESLLYKNKNKNNKNLIIFISGHGPINPNEKNSVKTLINDLQNHDVLYLSIFNRGFNKKFRNELSFKGLDKNVKLDNNNILQMYDDKDQNIYPLSLFLSGNYHLIKDVISKKKYDQITLNALSGGSIPGLFYGALFNEIDNVLIFDGALPLKCISFSSKKPSFFYYNDNKFLDKYDFDTLYFLLIHKKKKLRIYFSNLYWDKSYQIFQNLFEKYKSDNFIIKKNLLNHDFDKNIILNFLK